MTPASPGGGASELDARVVAARGRKNRVDPFQPYAFLVEPELSAAGTVDDVATLFLTNKECPFRCVYCDLWKNTLDESTAVGAIPAQIDFALQRLPPAKHIKLYNSGNFFDPAAIPTADHRAIIERVHSFDTVIVENHPLLCGDRCVRFAAALGTELEVALGLETIHPIALAGLNRRMTVDDFAAAARFLRSQEIAVRTFVMLQPPGVPPSESVDWAVRSVRFAIEQGARVVSLIPTRGGDGLLNDALQRGGFTPPSFDRLEEAFWRSLDAAAGQARVLVDLWNAAEFAPPGVGVSDRIERLNAANLTQLR